MLRWLSIAGRFAVRYELRGDRAVVGAGQLSERDLRLLRRRTAAAIVVHVHSLTFRITSRQLRNLLIGALFITATAVGSGIAAADRAGPGGSTMASAVGLGIAALLYFYVVAAYAVARTECKPTGIPTRGVGGPRSCAWADVRDISVRRAGPGSLWWRRSSGGASGLARQLMAASCLTQTSRPSCPRSVATGTPR